MKKDLNKISTPFFVSLFCAILLIVINIPDFILYWVTPFIQGWDGQGHASIGQYYAENIFPNTWGWTPNWYLGMPFPQYYPPLFYFLLALISKILPFLSYLTIFKSVVTILQLLVPAVIVFFVSRRTKETYSIWISGIFASILVSSYFIKYGALGIDIVSTLHTGMVTQLISFIFLILWLNYFLKIEQNIRSRFLSGIFLFLTLLSNAHNNIVVLIIFATTYTISIVLLLKKLSKEKFSIKIKNIFKHFTLYFLSGFIPLAATSFWLLPLLYTYQYFVTAAVIPPPPFMTLMHQVILLPISIAIGLLFAWKHKNKDIGIISTSIIVILLFAYITKHFDKTGMPTHGTRWIGLTFFMFPIIIGLSYEYLLKIQIFNKRKITIFILSIILLVIGAGTFETLRSGGYYVGHKKDKLNEIISFIQENKENLGIIMTESFDVGMVPVLFVFDSLIGQNSLGTSVFVLRESSINSIFNTPIRNSFSSSSEGWGFRSFIVFDTDFKKQNINNDLDRAWNSGIQSFIVKATSTKNKLSSDKRITLIKDFDNWELYTFKEKAPRASVVKNNIVLFYGEKNFKERSISDYDWARLQEEILFHNSQDITMIYPENQYLDNSDQMFTASTTIISDYKYKDLETAFENLVEYSKNNQLILIAKDDPLFYELQNTDIFKILKIKNVRIIDRLNPTILNTNPVRSQIKNVFNSIKKFQQNNSFQNKIASSLEVANTEFSDKSIKIYLNGTSTTPIPILIKSTYFPAWKRVDGSPLYLATPGFTLTYATSSFEMYFDTPNYVRLGRLISVLAALITLGMYLYWRISNKKRGVSSKDIL